MAAMLSKSSLRMAKSAMAPRAARMAVRVRAAEEDKAAEAGSVFYGGKSYTESEWKEAQASGAIMEPAAAAASPVASGTPSIASLMAFSGAAPETTNGRLAMLGFIAAVGAELSSGEGVLRQWSEEPTGIALAFIIFMAASLVPMTRGAKAEAFGPFTPNAELINGRAAMIGFASLLAIEAIKGSPLF